MCTGAYWLTATCNLHTRAYFHKLEAFHFEDFGTVYHIPGTYWIVAQKRRPPSQSSAHIHTTQPWQIVPKSREKLEEEEEEDGTRGYPLPYNHVPPPASQEGSGTVIALLRGEFKWRL